MKDKIIRIIEETLKVAPGSITAETQIADVEEWDSLAHVMILGALEEQLGLSIPLEEAMEMTSVSEILELAEGK